MTLPNYILIGAMKSGTTSLRYALHQHPEVFMTYPEEARFFYRDDNYDKGLDWYATWFEAVKKEKAIGESSGFYSYASKFPDTAARIVKHLPQVKILYLVRNPIHRIESHWSWEIASGNSIGDINKAVQEQDYFLEQSKYWKQISAYRSFFSDTQIKVLFFEDMINTPDIFFQTLWQFLEVDIQFIVDQAEQQNKTEGRVTDSSFLIKLRRAIPFDIQTLNKYLPDMLKRQLIKTLKTTEKATPKWNQKILEQVQAQLLDDSRQFLEYADKSENYWSEA